MPDIFKILSVSQSALVTQQKAIDVASNNIANVNTPGYTRQQAKIVPKSPVPYQGGFMGTGVEAVAVERVYDRFLGVQIRQANQEKGRWEAKKNAVDNVEMILNETNGYGLSYAMSEFWNAWQDLANNPTSHTERFVLIGKTETLATTFSEISSNLRRIRDSLDAAISGSMGEINKLTGQIAELNQKITKIEVAGETANTFRDQRELALKELSEFVDLQAFEDANGYLEVAFSDGNPLVTANKSWQLSAETGQDGNVHLMLNQANGFQTDITANISGGKLKGWLEGRDETIENYLTQLDELATTLMDRVNAFHRDGYGIDGTTGIDFFTGSSAADMKLNPLVSDNINSIAAADVDAWDEQVGNSDNAVRIGDLQYALTMKGATTSFGDFYHAIVSNAGNEVQRAGTNLEHQSDMISQMEDYRESVSGVSLDEEMINLVKYQHAYDAAAKLITMAEELLDSIIRLL